MRPSFSFDRSPPIAVAFLLGAFGVSAALTGCAGATGETRAPAQASPAPEVPPPSTPPAPSGVNPFVGARLYVNPDYVRAVEALTAEHPAEAPLLRKMESLPTAIWLSWISDTKGLPRYLEDAHRQERALGKPVLPVFVVYDLPGRDCAAEASAGELGPDADGEARYRREFIDPIAAALRARPDQRAVVVLEPDSLSNLVTNLERPKCAAAAEIYKRGIAYAVSQLSLPNVFIYLEAAHAGWLGFPKNIGRAAKLYREVLTMGGGADRVRGFALNVSNYDPAVDPAKTPRDRTSAASDETGYAADLTKALADVGVTGKRFVIDTGRNGQAYIRSIPSSWCNVKGAGLGERPRATPSPLVDAYLYIKTPGESDGTSDPHAPRFDQVCGGDDAAPDAPQAGKMFDSYLLDLLRNAKPPL
ncbi:MAG TPA: glycoside hydrolase family 6 protein [Polyangia bacterium]|nr:glycoside hydrolase family 6 protein [Polyangia bacterium]